MTHRFATPTNGRLGQCREPQTMAQMVDREVASGDICAEHDHRCRRRSVPAACYCQEAAVKFDQRRQPDAPVERTSGSCFVYRQFLPTAATSRRSNAASMPTRRFAMSAVRHSANDRPSNAQLQLRALVGTSRDDSEKLGKPASRRSLRRRTRRLVEQPTKDVWSCGEERSRQGIVPTSKSDIMNPDAPD
jgi:hypothetical protein